MSNITGNKKQVIDFAMSKSFEFSQGALAYIVDGNDEWSCQYQPSKQQKEWVSGHRYAKQTLITNK